MSATFLALLLMTAAGPDLPIIREPTRDGQIVGASDLHMEAAPMRHADPNRTHDSSDWEVLTDPQRERIWRADAARGPEKNHIHLGDGKFIGSHAGRVELLYGVNYIVRVRFRDDLGAVSEYAERRFATASEFEVLSLQMHDILPSPLPTWRDDAGVPVVVPADAAMRIDTGADDLFLEWTAAGASDTPPLDEHAAARLRFAAGEAGWRIPVSQVDFHTDDAAITLFLPALKLAPHETLFLWISDNGSTYWADSATQPFFGYFNLARSNPIPWRVREGYHIEPFARDLALVVNVAMAPQPGPSPLDILCYAAELHGDVKAITRNGTVLTYATGLLNYDPNDPFPGVGEKGLTGIAIDPASGDVLVGAVYWANPPLDGIAQREPDPDGGANGSLHPVFHNHVIRLHSDDGGRTAASRRTILDIPEPTGPAHQVGALYFEGDALFVHVGDGNTPDTARDLNSFLGKILRMHADGSPYEDNPFYDPSDGITAADYVYALGFRNPFGGAIRQIDGEHICVENGPATDRMSRTLPAHDYGWNGYDESMVIDAAYNWFPAVAPVDIIFCEPTRFDAGGFPRSAFHTAFVSEFGPAWAPGTHDRGKRITQFQLTPGGRVLAGPTPLIQYNGARLGRATVSALAFGPGGLYFSDFFKDLDYNGPYDRGSNLYRIVYDGDRDDIPPKSLDLACPQDYTVLPESDSGATANYPDITVPNAVGELYLRFDPPLGSTLPMGTTVVHVVALDDECTSGACEFAVTVDAGKQDSPIAGPGPIDTASATDQPDTGPTCGSGVCPGAGGTILLLACFGLLPRRRSE
ncbi:MAG: PQQ-dependent sugar dehydrogenase [Phycisphaerae bacterium]